MEILGIIGWLAVGFLPTLGLLELAYHMGKIAGRKGERYPWRYGKLLTH